MMVLPPGLAALVASGVTTLCHCWRFQRRDGLVLGFTDHDRDLVFGGVTYQAETGFTAAETESSLGLAVDTDEVSGAVSTDAIADADIALGLWDDADVEIWIVDWTQVDNRLLERAGSLGEVTRGDLAYEAEIRGLVHRLNQDEGRTYQLQCDAVLGDARCGVDLTSPARRGSGTVLGASDDRLLSVSGLAGFAGDLFTHGVLAWTAGANRGARVELRGHSGERLVLWRRAARPVVAGDAFIVTAGCARTFDMCRSRFGNGANFRGFPHIPGNDFALGVAKKSEVNDGSSFFR